MKVPNSTHCPNKRVFPHHSVDLRKLVIFRYGAQIQFKSSCSKQFPWSQLMEKGWKNHQTVCIQVYVSTLTTSMCLCVSSTFSSPTTSIHMVSPYTDEKKSQESSSFMIFTRALFIFDSITTYFSFDCFNFEMSTFLIAKILVNLRAVICNWRYPISNVKLDIVVQFKI